MSGKYESFDGMEVLFTDAIPMEAHFACDYAGFHPGREILPAGHVRRPGMMPLPAPMVWERDQMVPLRDGVQICVNIYRPVTEEKVPAIVAWGDFGRLGGTHSHDIFPNRCGIPLDSLSGYEKYEGPDPGYWIQYGYAVVCPDARGAFDSEGDIYDYGSQVAEDGYDLIEWLARQDWCSGKIGMSGNSQLAISQWFIAAENPPHLAAIAPWEGAADLYRDMYFVGGLPNDKSAGKGSTCGRGRKEDMEAMIAAYPFCNAYWKDKCSRPEAIQAPAYVVASFTNFYHTHGTFDNFRRLGSREKWLRVHNTLEWPDYYDEANKADLRRFFDCYLKGVDNGWRDTPPIRMAVLDPGGKRDIVGRPEEAFPYARRQVRPLWLDAAAGALLTHPAEAVSAVSYDAETLLDAGPEPDLFRDGEQALMDWHMARHALQKTDFSFPIREETEVSGYIKVKLWVQAPGCRDMDIFVRISTLGPDGEIQYHNAIWYNYTGPSGRLRVSLRKLNPEKSTPEEPYLDYDAPQYLENDEIVPIEIGLWPTSQVFHPGETLRLTVAAFDYLGKRNPAGYPETCNRGRHVLYTGGPYDAHLLLPVAPPKEK